MVLVALLVAAVGAGAYFLWFRPQPQPKVDMDGAMAANVRGVGLVEQHKFAEAEKEFEEAVRLAPDWQAPRVNLGIALFNQDKAEQLDRARQLFGEVLKSDPNNKHAHYSLGIICTERGPFAEAFPHFEAVNKQDPDDAHTWLRMGLTHPKGKDSDEARDCFEQALKRNPYLNAARYNLAMVLRATDPKRADELLAEQKRLYDATAEAPASTKYSEQGKYADVIGRDPKLDIKPIVGPLPMFENANLKVTLAAGTKWATAADLDPVLKAARERFGGAVVLFDFNGDQKPDIFLCSAVQGGKVHDLLLRNDGNRTFTEVAFPSAERSLGAAAGDFDNDGKPDLVVTGVGGVKLFRNAGNDKFEDASAAAGLDKLRGAFLGCGWLDVDQDGDLDLVLCKYADGDPGPFDGAKPGGEFVVFENVGVAQPVAPNAPAPGLTVAFQRGEKFPGHIPNASAVGVIASDLDSDQDVDLLLLADTADPFVVENSRLMRLTRGAAPWAANLAHKWNGGLVLDANHDERSDLFLVRAGAAPVFLLSKGVRDFTPGTTNSPTLKQAVAADIDMDGWADVVGLGADGKPVLLHNQADGKLTFATDAFGPGIAAHALAVADLDGDGAPDLLTWAEGLKLYRNLGNGNAAVLIEPTGRRDKGADMRTNNDGIGTWLVAQSGSHWTGAERTTVSAGLGQSLVPTALGLGKQKRADVVRLRWTDSLVQAEIDKPASAVVRIVETNRKGTSCPVLMAWDGEKFAFVTDFLGVGALGESGPDGSVRPARGQESVKIEAGQLVPKDGQFVLKIAEPMDEVLYLDHLKLEVIDAPAGAPVFPDERFVFSGPEPTQKLLAFKTRHFPNLATDHANRDVLPLILTRDRRAVDGFARRSWLGYAEDHSITLDFGDLPAGANWYVVLAGWTEYPYPESMYAATRAGVAIKPPVLERQSADGKWEVLCDLGFPAGLPRVMTCALPADFKGGKVRISTNMQVFWDQIFVARAEDASAAGKVTTLSVSRAELAHRGFMQEVYPNGKPPIAYDDAKTEAVAVTKWKGHLTRLGDVTELLTAADDRFVLCGPGDEITVRFDAKALPELPAGWTRSFVLRTHGYCKDTSTTTVTGGHVGPLPFAAMPNYPHFGTAKPPTTDADRWHTRPAGGR